MGQKKLETAIAFTPPLIMHVVCCDFLYSKHVVWFLPYGEVTGCDITSVFWLVQSVTTHFGKDTLEFFHVHREISNHL